MKVAAAGANSWLVVGGWSRMASTSQRGASTAKGNFSKGSKGLSSSRSLAVLPKYEVIKSQKDLVSKPARATIKH